MTDGEDSDVDFGETLPDGTYDEPLGEDYPDDTPDVSAPDVSAPEVEAPRVEPPTAEAPSPSDPATRTNPESRTDELQALAADVDPEFKVLFWKLVLLYKLGIIGLALGTLLTVFGSHPTRGPALAIGGAGLVVYAMVLTRRGKARLDAGEFDLDTDATTEEPSQ